MPRQKRSKGNCAYCGEEITKGGVTKHLSSCSQRQAIIEKTERKKAERETLYHLRVQDTWKKEFWLNLEMRGKATLNVLDDYLRAIWLECCGHLSRFSFGGWEGNDISMKRKAGEIFDLDVELTHIYDFGTSSETLIKVVEMREGWPTTARPIALMARNLMPESRCLACKQPATRLCMECLIEDDKWGTLCDKHAQTHPHDNYGSPMRLVNSPRLGMCGYDGSAEPPY